MHICMYYINKVFIVIVNIILFMVVKKNTIPVIFSSGTLWTTNDAVSSLNIFSAVAPILALSESVNSY